METRAHGARALSLQTGLFYLLRIALACLCAERSRDFSKAVVRCPMQRVRRIDGVLHGAVHVAACDELQRDFAEPHLARVVERRRPIRRVHRVEPHAAEIDEAQRERSFARRARMEERRGVVLTAACGG